MPSSQYLFTASTAMLKAHFYRLDYVTLIHDGVRTDDE